jgi:hypothetical protein
MNTVAFDTRNIAASTALVKLRRTHGSLTQSVHSNSKLNIRLGVQPLQHFLSRRYSRLQLCIGESQLRNTRDIMPQGFRPKSRYGSFVSTPSYSRRCVLRSFILRNTCFQQIRLCRNFRHNICTRNIILSHIALTGRIITTQVPLTVRNWRLLSETLVQKVPVLGSSRQPS